MSRKQRFEQGFTLVELMVVVAIIGILAAIGIPQMAKYIRNAETAEPIAQGGRIEQNIRGWVDSHSSSTLSDLINEVNNKVVSNNCASNCLTTVIPEVEVSNDHKWAYRTGFANTNNEADVCVRAEVNGTATEGYVLYSGSSTSSPEWKTHSWTQSYVTTNSSLNPTNSTGSSCGTVPSSPN